MDSEELLEEGGPVGGDKEEEICQSSWRDVIPWHVYVTSKTMGCMTDAHFQNAKDRINHGNNDYTWRYMDKYISDMKIGTKRASTSLCFSPIFLFLPSFPWLCVSIIYHKHPVVCVSFRW